MYTSVNLLGPWQIENKLRSLCAARSEDELMTRIKDCSEDIAKITQVAVLKQSVSQSATKSYT